MPTPAADRAMVSLCIDCAARINHDGKAITVIADAGAILEWLEARLAERARADSVRAAISADAFREPANVRAEINDLLSRDAGGRKRESPAA